MQDFAIISRCAFRIPISSKDAVAPENEDIMTLENIRVENTVLRNNTGITALFFSAAFLDVSYSPSNAADKNANANHILIHKTFGKFKNYYYNASRNLASLWSRLPVRTDNLLQSVAHIHPE